MKALPIHTPATLRLLEEFSTYLRVLGYRPGTIHMLPVCVREFMHRLECSGKHSLRAVRADDIRSYYTYLQERPNTRRSGGLSAMMIRHHLYALRILFAWQERIGEIDHNPMSGLEFARAEAAQRLVPEASEISRLYAACESLRDRALLALYYGCGLRRSEGVALDTRDIHFRSGLLYVRSGKGGLRRVLPLSAGVRDDLWSYYRDEHRGAEPAYLLSYRGGRLSGGRANARVRELAQQAGITTPISLHALRHAIARDLLRAGARIEQVRDFLGHRHLESTQVYLAAGEPLNEA